MPFKDDTIEQLEVITEFRRFVLAAEEELKGGNWMMGRGGYDQKGRSLKEILRPFAGQVSIRARAAVSSAQLLRRASGVRHPARRSDAARLCTSIRSPHVTRLAGDGSPATSSTARRSKRLSTRRRLTIEFLPIRIVSEGKELARVNGRFFPPRVGFRSLH